MEVISGLELSQQRITARNVYLPIGEKAFALKGF